MFLQAVSHEAVYWNSNKMRGAAVSVSLSSFAFVGAWHSAGGDEGAIASLGAFHIVGPGCRAAIGP